MSINILKKERMRKILFKFDNDNKKYRVDTYISFKELSLSRSKVKKLILSNNLKINEIIVNDPSYVLKLGDNIEFCIQPEKMQSLKPYEYKLDIVFEDDDIIVINKSSGISMHPGAGNLDNTIVNALINYKKKLSSLEQNLRPGIVHRIDKNTSGLIVIAKNNQAHEHLSNQFSSHTISRVYQLLVWGKIRPSKGKIQTLITRSSKNRQLMEVSNKKGKKAITNYKTLEIFENENTPTLSLLECKLETGRTHQIRVHMNYLGNSIVGDDKYKKKFKKIKDIDKSLADNLSNLKRQFLHAKTIGFIHPKKNKEMKFNSILPQDLEIILKMLRNTKK